MLKGQVCLVTGASRGIGRGIALQLGEAGAKVYITGRQPKESDSKDGKLPTLQKVAEEINERGGEGVAVYCDHSKEEEIKALFERIEKDNDGRLDLLVNNAYAAINAIADNWGKTFWEQDPLVWDTVNNVGLRNHYICSVYASRLMVPRRSGLIVTVSSLGGLKYMFNVPYGVGKAACDRMAQDIAHELKKYNVTAISLWPGAVKTEMFGSLVNTMGGDNEPDDLELTAANLQTAVAIGETVEYAGRAIVHFAADPNRITKTGRTLLTADLGDEYGFVDTNGNKPPNNRSIKMALAWGGYTGVAAWVPEWVKFPLAMFTFAGNKF